MIIETVTGWLFSQVPAAMESGGTILATHVGDTVESVGSTIPLLLLALVGALARFFLARCVSSSKWSWTSMASWFGVLLISLLLVGPLWWEHWIAARHLVSGSRDDIGAIQKGYQFKTPPLAPAHDLTKVRAEMWPCFLATRALILTAVDVVLEFFNSAWSKFAFFVALVVFAMQMAQMARHQLDKRSRAKHHTQSVNAWHTMAADHAKET